MIQLSHPHIVKVMDVDEHDGVPFAVLQYLAGGSLENRCPQREDGTFLPVKPQLLIHWLSSLAQALDFIHHSGYVHRDIKPANTLFDENNHVFLSDFGIAKAVGQDATSRKATLTGSGMVIGTREYMAPEALLGDVVDARADQFSLAVMAAELLLGRTPFGDHIPGTYLLANQSQPADLRRFHAKLSVKVARVFAKAFAFEPSNRFAGCVEMVNELRAAMTRPPATGQVPQRASASQSPPLRQTSTIPTSVTHQAETVVSGNRSPSSTSLGKRWASKRLAGIAVALGIVFVLIVTGLLFARLRSESGSTKDLVRKEVRELFDEEVVQPGTLQEDKTPQPNDSSNVQVENQAPNPETQPEVTAENRVNSEPLVSTETERSRADANEGAKALEAAAKIELAKSQLDAAKVALSAAETKSDGLARLSSLLVRDELPEDADLQVRSLFDEQTDHSAQLWLLRQCDQYVGQFEQQQYAAFELFWLWYAYTAMGEHAEADTRLNDALSRIARMESSNSALDAAGELAGWLCHYKQDKAAMRALKLGMTAQETAKSTWQFTRCYFAAMAYLLGDLRTAQAWHQQARGHDRWPDYTDAMYYAIARDFDKAMRALEQVEIPYNTAIVARAAAVAGREAEYVKAKRYAIEKIPAWEKTRGENMNGVRLNLIVADAIMGDFDLAERRAAGLPDSYKWMAFGYLAREYALAGKIDEAKQAFQKTYLAPQTVEATFWLWRARMRNGESLSDLYSEALSMGTDCAKLVGICGIIGGLNEDLPTRHIRTFSFH